MLSDDGTFWDHEPKRRASAWLPNDHESHAYGRWLDGAWTMRCRPMFMHGGDEGMDPRPPEMPLCPDCARITGIAGKLRRPTDAS